MKYKDKILFLATYRDNNMDQKQRKDLAKCILTAGKVKIVKAGQHEKTLDLIHLVDF